MFRSDRARRPGDPPVPADALQDREDPEGPELPPGHDQISGRRGALPEIADRRTSDLEVVVVVRPRIRDGLRDHGRGSRRCCRRGLVFGRRTGCQAMNSTIKSVSPTLTYLGHKSEHHSSIEV